MAPVRNSPTRLQRLMGVLLVALVAYGVDPVASTAHAETCYPDGSGNELCVDVANTDLVQLSPTPMFAMTEGEYTALRHLEGQSVGAVRVRHGLTDTGDDRVLTYARSPLRAEMLGQVLAAAEKDPGARNADEQTVLAWYAKVRQRMNVDAATKAVNLYADFYGEAEPGEIPDNACTFTSPAPFEEDYPGPAGRWIGCFGTPPVGDLGPRIPTFEDFTKWGLAVSVAEQTNTGGSALATLLARDAIALAAASSVTAIAAVGVALIEALAANAVSTFFLPFAAIPLGVTASATAVAPAAASSFLPAAALEAAASAGSTATGTAVEAAVTASGFSVGLAAAVVTTIIIALTILIITSINIGRVGQLRDDLLANLFEAATTPVDPVADLHTDGGLHALTTTIQSVTVSSNLPATPQPTVDAADPVFRITSALGNPAPGRSDTWTYVSSPSPDGVYREGTTAIRSGWLAAPDGARDPAASLSMPLWDPEGGISPRAGFDHDAVVSTVMVGGQRKFLATVIGRDGYPKTGTQCADYHEDGCWVTDKLPFLGTAGVADRRYVELVPESPPAVLIDSASSVPQRTALEVSAAPDGVVVDPDGDPVTYTWQVTGCPLFATDCDTAPRTGPTQSYVFPTQGDYTMRLTATDSLGRSDVETRSISVTNAAPALTATLASTVLEGDPVQLTGTVVDGLGEPVSVSVDWGDGSPPSTASASSLSGVLEYDLSHTYAEPNPADPDGDWDVVVTASDGVATTDTLRTVTVGNRPPTLTVDGPPAPTTYEPGTVVTLSGSADDFGPVHPLTLDVTWYDGEVDHVAVPDTGTRSWTVEHTVTAALVNPAQPLATLVLTDRFDATDQVAIVGGVFNRPPAFADLVVVAPAAARTPTAVSGTLRDPNGEAVTLVVDWGDGTDPEEVSRTGGASALDLTHTYARRGVYTVELTATDAFGLSTETTLEVPVAGDRPLVTGTSWRDGTPAEGRLATLQVAVVQDPDRDNDDAVLHWGDGGVSAVSVPAGATSFSAVHLYADDGSYDVEVELTDADGTTAFLVEDLAVDNLDPTAQLEVTDQLGRPVGSGDAIPLGSRVAAVTRAADPGPLDELSGTLAWGDGGSVRVLSALDRNRFEHLYLDRSARIDFAVADGDGGLGEARLPLRVLAPRPQSRELAEAVSGRAKRILAEPPRGAVALQAGLVEAAGLLQAGASRNEALSVGLLAVSAARLQIADADTSAAKARRLLARAGRQLDRLRPVAAAKSARAAVAALPRS